jgi:hypothetical protein
MQMVDQGMSPRQIRIAIDNKYADQIDLATDAASACLS